MSLRALYCSTLFTFSLLTVGCSSIPFTATQAKTATNADVQKVMEPFSGKLPINHRVIKGTLDNGIQYIIQKNSKPTKRAEIRLAINAGSTLEDDNQQGFAHFVEHMAFNGTQDFKKQEIVEYIESIGMRFGAHLNAHTSFDETVYKLQIPTNKPELLETGIHILENWAHKISFEPEEIDKERGVVIEELRTRQGANNRIMNKQLPVLYKGSRYAERLPIGKKIILEQGKHSDLIRFYKNWYRPDLMTLVAVGDFEPEDVKALFEQYFGKIKRHQNQPKRTTFTVGNNKAPRFSIETDPELTRTIINVQIKQPADELGTYQAYRQQLARGLFVSMLNSRFRDDTLKANSPLIAGGVNYRRSFGGISMFSMGSAVKPGKNKEALTYMLSEVNRVIQHGFTDSELKRQKLGLLNAVQRAAKEVDKVQSRRLAEEYVRHFMQEESIPGIEHEAEITEYFLTKISVAEINVLAKKWFTKENRLIAISAPTSEKGNLLNQDEILALWQAVEANKFNAFEDVEIAEQLMTAKPKAGSIIAKSYNTDLDFHTWTLSNGVKVLLKKTDFKADSISFSARTWGGFSSLNNETYHKAMYTSAINSMMGLGDMSYSEFSKFKKGKSFSLRASIGSNSQSLKGGSSIKDLPYFMQNLYLSFAAPRKDIGAFNTFLARTTASIENRFNSPSGVFSEAIRLAQYGNDPRSLKMDVNAIQMADLDTSLAVYQNAFSNAANFNFVFVGNIDLAKMEGLLSTYVASLPTSKALIKHQFRKSLRTKGELTVNVAKSLDPKATIVMKTYGNKPWNHKERAQFNTMKAALSTVLRERIREEKSGAYGVRVGGSFSREQGHYSLSISFTCDPLRVDELKAEVNLVIHEFKTVLQDEKYVANYIKQSLKSAETSKKQNNFWIGHLTWLNEPGYVPLSFSDNEALLKSMTPADVKAAANMFIDKQDSLVAILMPEVNAVK